MDLISAVVSNDKNAVISLLLNGAPVDAADHEITALHQAVLSSSIEIIFLLVEFGANPNKRHSEFEKTPFELACSINRYDAISFFTNLKNSTKPH